jgi:hypothetical protein
MGYELLQDGTSTLIGSNAMGLRTTHVAILKLYFDVSTVDTSVK